MSGSGWSKLPPSPGVVTMAGVFAGLKSGFAPSTVMKNFELGLSSEHFSWLFGVREAGELTPRSSAGLI
jgi:hypothetical protein